MGVHPRRTRNSLSRAEILDAAMAIVTDEGLEHLSMRNIAHRLSCSVASPYAHFENQEEMIKELIKVGEAHLTSALKDAQSSSEDVFEQLNAIAQTYWSFSVNNRELHKLMFNMNGNAYRKVFQSLPTSYRVFLETLRNGVVSGKIPYTRNGYRAIARTMWAWMYGLIVLEMTGMLRKRTLSDDPVGEGIAFFTVLLRQGSPSLK